MSEAKPQDGSTVKGYRTLTPGDVERMNRLKGVSRHFCSLLDTEREVLAAEVVERGSQDETERTEALRWIDIARQNMQLACMAACRSVAKPDADF